MLRKEKDCRKKWDKFTYSKNEGEKYHKSDSTQKPAERVILLYF